MELSNFEGNAHSPGQEIPCVMCYKPAIRQCRRCHSTPYCGRECQESDWLIHKLLCRQLERYGPSTRPAAGYSRAIYFPVDNSGPFFFWTQVYALHLPGMHILNISTPQEFGEQREDPKNSSFSTNEFHQRPLPCEVQILNTDARAPSSFLRNFMSLTKLDRELKELDVNAMLFYSLDKDLGPSDLRDITDYLRLCYDEAYKRSEIEDQDALGEDALRGVRVNAVGDIRIFNHAPVERCLVSPTLNGMGAHHPAPISECIGIPLLFLGIPRALVWRNRMLEGVDQGHNATMYKMDGRNWGAITGSYVVVRQDRKPLHVPHILALTAYCEAMYPQGSGQANELSYNTNERVTEAGFREFYEVWKRSRAGQLYIHFVGPYDI